jgi:hypothetical protein
MRPPAAARTAWSFEAVSALYFLCAFVQASPHFPLFLYRAVSSSTFLPNCASSSMSVALFLLLAPPLLQYSLRRRGPPPLTAEQTALVRRYAATILASHAPPVFASASASASASPSVNHDGPTAAMLAVANLLDSPFGKQGILEALGAELTDTLCRHLLSRAFLLQAAEKRFLVSLLSFALPHVPLLCCCCCFDCCSLLTDSCCSSFASSCVALVH